MLEDGKCDGLSAMEAMNAFRCSTSSAASSAIDFWRATDGNDDDVVVVVVVSVADVLVCVEFGDALVCVVGVTKFSRLVSFVKYSGDSDAGNDLLVGVPALLFEVRPLNLCIAFICGSPLAPPYQVCYEGEVTYDAKEVRHLPCECMVDFQLVRGFYQLGAVLLLRKEGIDTAFRHPRVILLD